MPIGGVRAGYLSTGKNAIPDSGNLQSQYVASSFSLNDGDAINSAWEDKQGNFDASVFGSPVYRASAANGEPVVEFDGSNDYFDTGFAQDTNNARSIYIVTLTDVNDVTGFAYGSFDLSGSTNRTSVGQTSPDYFSSYGDTFNGSGTATTSAFELYEVNTGSGSGEMFINGSSQHTFSYTGQGTSPYSDLIGARNKDGSPSSYWDGQIAEILRYTVSHDSTTASNVRYYLNDKYALY